MKNRNIIELTLNLENLVSANDDVIKNCESFIQTVLYNGTSKELMWKRGCDCTISKKQRAQYHFLQILCHASKLFLEQIVSHILGSIVPINFPSTFTNV